MSPSEALNEATRRAIESAPVSARQLAELAGLHPSTVARIVSGGRNATMETAAAIAAGLSKHAEQTEAVAESLREALRKQMGV